MIRVIRLRCKDVHNVPYGLSALASSGPTL